MIRSSAPPEEEAPALPSGTIIQRFGLTPSELRVALALTEGKTPAAIAAQHGISLATVRTHLRRLYEKQIVERTDLRGVRVLGYSNASEIANKVTAMFERGEFVAIMGESGVGKSTLLNLIGGLERPDAGELYLGGARVDGLV